MAASKKSARDNRGYEDLPTEVDGASTYRFARAMALLGATDDQLADALEMTLKELAVSAWHDEHLFNAITPRSEVVAGHKQKFAEWRGRRVRPKTIQHRLVEATRARIWHALKGVGKKGAMRHLDFTADDLREHLASRFQPGMSWENYGQWHIDHIRPCASFDLTDHQQFRACWSLSNLQPLWARDNLRKGARYAFA